VSIRELLTVRKKAHPPAVAACGSSVTDEAGKA
jgi:hypothetical protein